MFHVKQWDVGLDWLTMVSRETLLPSEWLRVTAAVNASAHERDPACRMREMSRHGYRGTGTPTHFIGTRDDGTMVSVSGYSSQALAEDYYPRYWRATRVDVRLDCWLEDGVDDAIVNAFADAKEARERVTWGFRRRVRLVDGAGDGNTLYVGARTSRSMLRCYNKQAESGDLDYAGCARIEVQYNADAANDFYKHMVDALWGQAAMVSTVLDYAKGAGVRVFGIDPGAVGFQLTRRVVPKGDTKTVLWLRNQVAPVVRRLTSAYGLEAVLEMLDISGERE